MFEAQLFGPLEPTEVTWTFGDGQTAQGLSAEVVYPLPGVYTVTATADFAEGDSQQVTLDVAVFDPAGGDVLVGTDLPMPSLLGDVDDDLSLTGLDVALIQDHVSGAVPLDASRLRTADFSLDGEVNQRDVDLLAESVNLFGALPNSVEPSTGPRGTMVQLMSEHLRDVDALVEVRVGMAPPRPIRRLHPGYGLFLVPMDAAGPATSQPIAAGPTFVELLVNGNTVHAFDFELTNPEPIMGDEVSLLRSSGHDLHEAAMALETLMAGDFEALGTTADDRILLRALVNAAATDFQQAATEIDSLTAGLTDHQRDRIAYMCSVSGLREASAAMQGSGLLSGGASGESRMGGAGSRTVDLVVGLGVIVDLAAAIDNVVQTTCLAASAGLALSAFWTGPWGIAAAASLASTCGSLVAGGAVISVVQALLPRMRGNLEMTPTLVFGVTPTTYSISVEAPLERDLICGSAVGIAEIIQGKLLEHLTSRITVLGSFGFLQRIPFDERTGAIRQLLVDLVEGFIDGLTATVSFALDAAGITQQIETLKTQVCQSLGGSTSISISSAELGPADVIPSNGGGLSSAGGGLLLEFACGNSGVTSVEIRGSLPVAGTSVPFQGSTPVTCEVSECPNGFLTPPGMAAIPAGTFLMGSNAASGAPYFGNSTAQPVHEVSITNCFWMGQHEVTQAEYLALAGSNPSSFQGATRPVETVSWHDARSYCAALTAQQAALGQVPTGYQYRLPTEAEWEYACRAGTTTEFHYGSALFCGDARLGYSYHSDSSCFNPSGTVPVGAYAPNAFGLYDMHGNVWEWCLDSWARYNSGAQSDPFVTGGSSRVLRGGGWNASSALSWSAFRNVNGNPGATMSNLGFRVVLAPVLVP
jgi:formylglycine-generating enzyme required for sulfatase activity